MNPLFDSIVHGLRSRGWSRFEAEGEALDRIERRRAIAAGLVEEMRRLLAL